MLNRLVRLWWRAWNALHGHGYSWIETPGTPAGGHIMPWDGTCPYALLNDWSAKACIKAGLCGCNERNRNV